ncbi:MAG: DUF3410 domain-containing protein, partial [Candidatus Sumerlaeia bacterium]|nr:DUF3410 domain-containing protein [Candidatus Sumerlaeia bacterium]
DCANLTLGIVGRGNIGRPLSQLARSLGMRVICNDPPLQQSGVEDEWGTLEEVFAESDVVTLHTPYTTSGPHATHHLIQQQHLELLGDRGFLINAARGNVLRNIPLFELLNMGRLKGAVLDCWENEPRLLPGLHELLLFGTPHIAGYSHDGKLEGTRQIVAAYARHLGLELPWKPVPIPPTQPMVTLSPKSDPWLVVREAVRHSYTIADDDAALRRFSIDLARTNPEMLEKHFDLLRKNYPLRREFAAYTITGIPHESAEGKLLHTMGFQFS